MESMSGLLKRLHIRASVVYSRFRYASIRTECLSPSPFSDGICKRFESLKVVTSEKIGGSGVTSTLGTWYGGVVMGVLLYFNEAAIL
jgi:hypothetical protein